MEQLLSIISIAQALFVIALPFAMVNNDCIAKSSRLYEYIKMMCAISALIIASSKLFGKLHIYMIPYSIIIVMLNTIALVATIYNRQCEFNWVLIEHIVEFIVIILLIGFIFYSKRTLQSNIFLN